MLQEPLTCASSMLLSSGRPFFSLSHPRPTRIKMDRVYCAKDEAQEESRGYTRKTGDNPKRLRPSVCLRSSKRGCGEFYSSPKSECIQLIWIDQDSRPQATYDARRVRRVSPCFSEKEFMLIDYQSSTIRQTRDLGWHTSEDDCKGLVRILFCSSQGRRES